MKAGKIIVLTYITFHPLSHVYGTLFSKNNLQTISPVAVPTVDLSQSLKQGTYENADIYSGLRQFAEVVSLIEQRGFRHVNFKNFIEEALKNAMSYCDPHSS